MPTRIYHKDHGYVITSDQVEIDMLIAKGGEIDKPKYNPTVQVKPEPVEVPEAKKRFLDK